MANILGDGTQQQGLALGRLGWPLRRIEAATGVRRETAEGGGDSRPPPPPAPAPGAKSGQSSVQRLWRAFRQPGAPQRQALKAIVFEGVPLDEVARLWNSNRNAIYKLLHDARRKLKAYLERRGFGVRDINALSTTQGKI
jgi:DNA-directed RNA polymerase specialized sigma24 family protein